MEGSTSAKKGGVPLGLTKKERGPPGKAQKLKGHHGKTSGLKKGPSVEEGLSFYGVRGRLLEKTLCRVEIAERGVADAADDERPADHLRGRDGLA